MEKDRKNYSNHLFRLHYHQNGSGNAIWLTFHGFGQNHLAFNPLASMFSHKGTFYNFDIFFHGESRYMPNKPIGKHEWVEFMGNFLKTHEIERFSLAGFSIGCRLMIPIIEYFAERIENVIFLAPDGIKDSFWYWVATKTFLQKFLRYTVLKPGWFFAFFSLLEKSTLVDKSFVKIVKRQMKDRQDRLRIYKTWVYFSKLKVRRRDLAKTLNAYKITSIVILSKGDKLIRERKIKSFLDRLYHKKLFMLDVPHHKLIQNATTILKSYLFESN